LLQPPLLQPPSLLPPLPVEHPLHAISLIKSL
jgi:hypothetical protein